MNDAIDADGNPRLINGKVDIGAYETAVVTPDIPTGVSASDGTYLGKIRISWTRANNAAGYLIYRNTTNVSATATQIGTSSSTNYDDSSATARTNYYYWVKATNNFAASGFSSSDSGYCGISDQADLAISDVDFLPRAIHTGASPSNVKFLLANNGSANMASNNTRIRLDFYLSPNNAYSDAAAIWIGQYEMDVVLSSGNSTEEHLLNKMLEGIVIPSVAEGEYYVFLRVNHTYPSTLMDSNQNDNITMRSGTIKVGVGSSGNKDQKAGNDFDGDGISDLVLYQKSTGNWEFLLSKNGYTSAAVTLGGQQYAPVLGDLDGDGRNDLIVYDESTGVWKCLLSGGGYTNFVSFVFGGNGSTPVVGNYDGDAKSDLAVYKETTKTWNILIDGISSSVDNFGGTGKRAVPGDFDGDGKTDLTVYEEATGTWTLLLSASGYAPTSFTFGGSGYLPVVGDYDWDGKTDPAIYNVHNGKWQILLSGSNYQLANLTLGGSGYTPMPLDYDGDGRVDPAVYNESLCKWIVMLSSGGYESVSETWGDKGYEPVGGIK